MSEWQTIDSAPKDGSVMLGFIPSEILGGCKIDHQVVTMYYNIGSDVFWTSSPGGYAIDGYLSGDPSHWMPLPTPPKDAT